MKRSVRSLSHSKRFVFSAVMAAMFVFPAGNAHADMPRNGLSPEALAAHHIVFDMPRNGLPPAALAADEGPFDMPRNGLPAEALAADEGPFDMPRNGAAPASIPAGRSLLEALVRGSLRTGAEQLMKHIVSWASQPEHAEE